MWSLYYKLSPQDKSEIYKDIPYHYPNQHFYHPYLYCYQFFLTLISIVSTPILAITPTLWMTHTIFSSPRLSKTSTVEVGC